MPVIGRFRLRRESRGAFLQFWIRFIFVVESLQGWQFVAISCSSNLLP